MVGSESPSLFLAVRGLSLLVTEGQIVELFRQYAAVKSVALLKDAGANFSKALAYVEFFSVEYAAYALQSVGEMRMDGVPLKLSFARESVMTQLLTQVCDLCTGLSHD